MNILFVCASNICRSPYCEFVFRRMAENDPVLHGKIEVSSSAVFNWMKEMDPKTRESLKREGFSDQELAEFEPRHWTHNVPGFRNADVIVGMTRLQKLLTPAPFRKKYVTLSEAATGTYHTIPDPYFLTDQDEYNEKMDVIKDYLQKYLDHLRQDIQ